MYGYEPVVVLANGTRRYNVARLPEGARFEVETPIPTEAYKRSKVELPDCRYLLYRGPIETALTGYPGRDPDKTANLWWPDDRAWCVGSDPELLWTYVAGPDELVAQLVADPFLEAFAVHPTLPSRTSSHGSSTAPATSSMRPSIPGQRCFGPRWGSWRSTCCETINQRGWRRTGTRSLALAESTMVELGQTQLTAHGGSTRWPTLSGRGCRTGRGVGTTTQWTPSGGGLAAHARPVAEPVGHTR